MRNTANLMSRCSPAELMDNLAEKVDVSTKSGSCLRAIGSAKSVRYTLKSMEKRSELSELSVMSWVSAAEGCRLSGVSLYTGVSLLCASLIDSPVGSAVEWWFIYFPGFITQSGRD